MNPPDIAFRPAKTEDIPFILSSWLKSLRKAPANKLLGNDAYFGHYHPEFTALLDRCRVLVATPRDDANQILGYAITATLGPAQVLVYVYVKHVFRGMGLSRSLISAAGLNLNNPFFYTYLSQAGSYIRKKIPHAVFDPFKVADLLKHGT